MCFVTCLYHLCESAKREEIAESLDEKIKAHPKRQKGQCAEYKENALSWHL